MSSLPKSAALPKNKSKIRRVAILFAGGPAPAANAVISAAAVSFLRNEIEVVGVLHGYSGLMNFDPKKYPLQQGRDYVLMDHNMLKRSRNTQGILIGTARDNPGKDVSAPAHLKNKKRCAALQTVCEALRSIGVDALVSIGGDDTLKTANKIKMYQDTPANKGNKKIPVVHVPKTIDNDYEGIDFTFGYFTAVDTLAGEIRNLLADAEAGRSYFLAETMGRSAGWLAYGAAIAGEASLVISVEDIIGKYLTKETTLDKKTGRRKTRPVMRVDAVIDRIVRMMLIREKSEGKKFGVIVLAEGLAEYLPDKYLKGVDRDDHGHIAVSQVELGKKVAQMVSKEYKRRTNQTRKITGLQLGYESRCARPHAFDVMLGSQLGVGAYRALVEEGKNGVMVSTKGQLELVFVKFSKLVDPKTLVTKVRHIQPNSDFRRLARFLETYVND